MNNTQRKPQPIPPTDISGRSDRARVNLELTLTQRINLAGVVGQQTGNAGEIRKYHKLLDKLALSEAESEATGLRADGNVLTWNALKAEELRSDIEFSIEEIAALSKIVKEWPHFRGADGKWLIPVLTALDIKE